MRAVFVFPRAPQEAVEQILDRLGPPGADEFGEWRVDGVLCVQTRTQEAGLYADWLYDDVVALERALGGVPSWAVVAGVSGRVPGDTEVRVLLRAVLADGGVTVDDYSSHPWTLEEVEAGWLPGEGRRFFDPA